MPDSVVVAREATELAAEVVRGRLVADGIESWLTGAAASSTAGAINELNLSWNNPLGGVEVRVRPEDAEEALAVVRAIYARPRERQRFPNALQIFVGLWVSVISGAALSSIHPGLGVVAGLVVFVGTIILARK